MSVIILPTAVDPIELSVKAQLGTPLNDIQIGLRVEGELALGQNVKLADILGRPITDGVIYAVSGRDAAMETLIARLQRTPSPAWMYYPTAPGQLFYVDELLAALFDFWASKIPWFRAAPVPRLYIRKATGLARPQAAGALIQPRDDGTLPTMAEVLDEWLASFPGYSASIYDGQLVIAPPRSFPVEILRGETSCPNTLLLVGKVPHPTRTLYITGAVAAYVGPSQLERFPFAATLVGGYAQIPIPAGQNLGPGTLQLSRSDHDVTAYLSTSCAAGSTLRVYAQVFFAPRAVPGGSVISIRSKQDFSSLVNRAVVENVDRYEFVGTNNVLAPSFVRVWGAYPGPGCQPNAEMASPSVADLGSDADGRQDLGLLKLKELGSAYDPYLPPQTVFVPASGTYVVGSYVDVTLTFRWWADQHCDSPGPSPAGTVTVISRVRVGEQATVRAWPTLPGPNGCPPEGAFADVVIRPSVNGRILEGVYLTISGAFANARWSICGGDWAVGLALLVDGSAPVLARSNARVVGSYEDVQSQSHLGILERRVTIRSMLIDAATATSIARAIVEHGMTPTVVYEVDLAPPYAAFDDLGYALEMAGIRGRVAAWNYHEAHEPDRVSVRCTVVLEDTVQVGYAAGGYYLHGAYGHAAY